MGKVDRLRLAALFWALGIVLANTCDLTLPACRPGITALPYTKHVLIWS